MNPLKIILALIISTALLSACNKEFSIENGGLKAPAGKWEFKDSTNSYAGNMDSAYIVTTGSTKELHLNGVSTDGTQNFNMVLYADSFNVGIYKASLFQSSFDYTTTAKTIYQADQLVGEFIVNITSISGGLITGIFSGVAKDSNNIVTNITLGKFNSAFASASSSTPSSGVLGDSSGGCKPVVLAGVYSQGVAVTSANTVQVEVTVAVPGSYTISTNTVNGITFSKTGTFASAGVQNVTLTASGTPTLSGNQSFTLSYGNSQCAFNINFTTQAIGTLGVSSGNCTPFTIAGTYQQGVLLNAGNTVQIQVNVTSIGGYNITSNTVNGVSFSNSGNFTTTGVQTVTLTGSGTPINPGLQNFSITFGASTCNFSITFLTGVAPSNDYFPLSLNSNWTYTSTSSDSILLKVINYSPSFNSNTYKTIAEYDLFFSSSSATDSFYYRKPGGDYYEYLSYSNLFGFDNPVSGEYIFLKDNVAAGSTWQSSSVSGTTQGVPITLYIKMTLLAKAVPVTIGTFNFPDVIKMKYEYYVSSMGSPAVVAYTMERWFAKNQGEIYTHLWNGAGDIYLYNVSSFQVF